MATRSQRSRLDRREFLLRGAAMLRRGAGMGVGLGLLPRGVVGETLPSEPPRVRRQVRLGRTGLAISDIGFRSGSDPSSSITVS